MIRHVITIAIASAVIADISAAQSAPATPKSLCWTARQLPECRSWVVTEFSVEYGVLSTRIESFDGQDFEQRWNLTLGRMTNVSQGSARGFTAAVGLADFADRGLPFRAEFRQRWWNSPVIATEASAGFATQFIRGGLPYGGPERGYGVTARVGAEYDWLGIDTRADVLTADGRTATGISAGLRASSKKGAVAFTLFGAGIVGMIILITSAGGV
jgi:hypothetical protein